MSLVENDMALLQQLLSLSDKINEIKVGMRRARSERRCSDGSTSDDHEERPQQSINGEGSAVTTLYVDNEAPQYFSRKNSVLRIPIPPRASNRFNRRPARKASEVLRVNVAARTSLREESSDEARQEIDVSEGSEGPLSPTLTYSHSSASSCASCVVTGHSGVGVTVGGVIGKKTRSSHSSIDSGLPPSPTESD